MNLQFEESELGYSALIDGTFVFFGHQKSDLQSLKITYPEILFRRVHQVHGDLLFQSQSSSPELGPQADAHFTDEKNLGLLISTADCMPIFVWTKMSSRILAIHAGWRGIANQITMKSITSLFDESERENLILLCGPHIQKESFLVQEDALTLLEKSWPSDVMMVREDWIEKTENGYLVDLGQILLAQMISIGLLEENVLISSDDTKSNSHFFSHRRDPQNKGRNLSFIAQIP